MSFALSGLLAMMPAERRATFARSLSIAGNAEWVSAAEARRAASREASVPLSTAERLVLQRARLGFLSARTVLAEGTKASELTQLARGGGKARIAWAEREWDIANWFWNDLSDEAVRTFDWELGVFEGRHVGEWGLVKLTGVHFLRESLASQETVETSQPLASTPAKNVGGRPPAAFADDLMCAVWASIYEGDLKPNTQSDVERAILQWASDNGHELSVTGARDKARKIFKGVTKP